MSPSSFVLWFSIGVHYWEASAEDRGREKEAFTMFIPPALFFLVHDLAVTVSLSKAIVSMRQTLEGLQLSLSYSNSSLRIPTVPSPQVL